MVVEEDEFVEINCKVLREVYYMIILGFRVLSIKVREWEIKKVDLLKRVLWGRYIRR